MASTLVDSTDSNVWTTGTSSATHGSLTVSIPSSVGSINSDQEFGGHKPVGSPLAFDNDGLGVDDDEITALTVSSGQTVTLTFSMDVLLSEVFFLDLFAQSESIFETALVDLGADGSIDLSFAAVEMPVGGNPGYLASSTGLPSGALNKVAFTIFAPDNDGLGSPDFALAGVRVSAVPVPAAGLLLIGALGGLAALKRRKAA